MFFKNQEVEEPEKIQKMYEMLEKITRNTMSIEVSSYWTGGFNAKVSYFNSNNVLCAVERRAKDIAIAITEAGNAAFESLEKDKKEKIKNLEEEIKNLTN